MCTPMNPYACRMSTGSASLSSPELHAHQPTFVHVPIDAEEPRNSNVEALCEALRNGE